MRRDESKPVAAHSEVSRKARSDGLTSKALKPEHVWQRGFTFRLLMASLCLLLGFSHILEKNNTYYTLQVHKLTPAFIKW